MKCFSVKKVILAPSSPTSSGAQKASWKADGNRSHFSLYPHPVRTAPWQTSQAEHLCQDRGGYFQLLLAVGLGAGPDVQNLPLGQWKEDHLGHSDGSNEWTHSDTPSGKAWQELAAKM